MLEYKNNMSCPTCTDPQFCTVDRRCCGKMDMDTCDWNKYQADSPMVPNNKAPYYEVDSNGRAVHPYLTHFVPGVHDRSIEGFGLGSKNNLIVIVIILALVYYLYTQNQQ